MCPRYESTSLAAVSLFYFTITLLGEGLAITLPFPLATLYRLTKDIHPGFPGGCTEVRHPFPRNLPDDVARRGGCSAHFTCMTGEYHATQNHSMRNEMEDDGALTAFFALIERGNLTSMLGGMEENTYKNQAEIQLSCMEWSKIFLKRRNSTFFIM